MGAKIRYIIAFLFLVQVEGHTQVTKDFPTIDSLTYSYYQNSSWDSLIKLGNYAVGQNIDYKYLRQRMGFAFFSRSQYGEAQKQFTKALAFDSFDSFSLEYLYLSYLYDGNDDAASVIAGRMNRETRKNLSVNLFKPVESIEFEYNYKYAGTHLRSAPQYFRIGFSSRLGSGFSLFQMYSNYSQTITVRLPFSERYVYDTQEEYYVLLKYSFSPYLKIKGAFHYLNTSWSIYTSSTNLGYIGLSADYPGFKLGGEFSFMNIDNDRVTQSGLTAGVKSQGHLGAYLTGELSLMTKADSVKGLIYNQKAGLRLSKKIWLEGNVTFGNLSDFSEFSAMYIYNTVDPTSFRCGSTLNIFPGRHLSLWFNFSYERKDFYENITYHYNQFSYLGGIKWKI
jgi:hypothetical protein